MKKFLLTNLECFIKTTITILALAYPFKICWNKGVCAALTCASQIDYSQSTCLIGMIVLFIVAVDIMKD